MKRWLDQFRGEPCADQPKGGDGDCCRPAVIRAHREMLASGAPDTHCLDVAEAVYRWHHPDASKSTAAAMVDLWLTDGRAWH